MPKGFFDLDGFYSAVDAQRQTLKKTPPVNCPLRDLDLIFQYEAIADIGLQRLC